MRFKTLFAALVLSGLTVVQASAQNFHLGLEAGANFSNFLGNGVGALGDPSTYNNSRLGLVGGGFLSLDFGNSFAIRPEVLYEQKGNNNSGPGTSIQLDYIEVPVLLKISLGTPVVNPGLLIGPAFAWNVLAKDVTGGNISNVSTSDIALVAGLELDIDKFLLSGRYEIGLDNVTNDNTNQLLNGTLTFLVGYSFM